MFGQSIYQMRCTLSSPAAAPEARTLPLTGHNLISGADFLVLFALATLALAATGLSRLDGCLLGSTLCSLLRAHLIPDSRGHGGTRLKQTAAAAAETGLKAERLALDD